ncbi:hypothetical protein ED733_002101 [Metarhizium rileyi]|uniref:ABC transporter, transmembrane domain, type 1 n=1 Tax=Metarhizium rileyi (strain RCEF 4871) TaxID=1649241 RepID=A0A5C6G8E2_METRR|nr:hypothetical protein ED733_002101 [Metarhizium rileyi]
MDLRANGDGKPGGTAQGQLDDKTAVDMGSATPDASKTEQGKETEAQKDGFGLLMRVLTFSSTLDRVIQIICAVAALCSGAALPLMAIVLGRLTADFTGFGSEDSKQSEEDFLAAYTSSICSLANSQHVYPLEPAQRPLRKANDAKLVYIWSFGFTFTANRTVQTLRLTCLDKILNRSLAQHDGETPGSLSNTITTQCNSIQTALSDRIGIMIQAFSMLLASFAVAFSQSWQLTLVMFGLVMITLTLIGGIVGSDQKIEAGLMKRYADCSAIAEDALGSIRTVVAFGAAPKFLSKYEKILVTAEKEGKKRGPLVGLMFACQYFFMFAGWAIGFYLGAFLYTRGDISDPGRILSVFFAMLIGLGAIMALGPNMPSFIKAIAASGIVFRLLDDATHKSDAASASSTTDLATSCEGNIQLRNVSFAYDSRPDRPSLSNVDIEFRRGTCTAVVGPSGAGKSTLIALLERWYQPTSGSILLDGRDVSKLDVKWLRRQIALVQQEPQLFNASIFENIAHGLVGTDEENATAEEKEVLVKQACDEARVSQFVYKLPDGIHTNVGDRASLISGGQKQRIAIARALVGRRPVLLMDEATSALDGENSEVIESLLTASENRTTIFITHKIMSAKRANRIVVMDKGLVAEMGTHSELLSANNLYKRLYDTQAQLEVDDEPVHAIRRKSTAKDVAIADDAAATEEPSEQHAEMPELLKRSLLTNLWTIASEQKRYWPIFFIGAAAAVVTAQIFPVQAILLGRVLQTFQEPMSQVRSAVNFWALMFFVVGLGALIAYATLGFFMTLFGMHLTTFYRLEYFRAVLLQRMEFFDRVASGAIVSRLSTDPANLHELISVNIGLLISIFVSVISGSIIALAYSWKFALVAIFGGMPMTFFAGFIRMKLDSSLAEATIKVFEESARFASDALSVIRTVKAFTMEDTVRRSYENHLSLTIGKLYTRTAVIMLFFALSESLELLAAALAFWYGGKLLGGREATTEQFFTVFIAVIVGGQAAGALFGFSSNIGKAKVSANNIIGIRSRVPKPGASDELPDVLDEKSSDAAIDFKNVSFSYPTRPNALVLNNISLRIYPGQTVGIVGESGSGKSTLMALLERFYEVQSGRLQVFGQSILSYDVNHYRSRLAIVPQEPTLYKGSIRDNIVLGVDETQVDDEKVVQACKAANLTDFIASLPDGYNTDSGSSMSSAFSGGQKQRVAIARALLREPEILLLDEPTSALDAESEQMVRDTLNNIQGGRTMVIITHRLNIVRNADIIIVMAGGKIVEQGSHDELVANRGHYFKMYQATRGEEL